MMVQTVIKQETEGLLEKITALHDLFMKNNDFETAEKARQLALKYSGGEYSIAFCGHFSAGKSSTINRLIGENILPSSPIPTSANLVKVKSGEEYAKVFFKKGSILLYPAPYNYDQVKTYCKDGDEIHSIEISHKTDKLPANAVIMDTPGIDSTDDAHRIATESALHLADLVFYVMDYNHVQSELNFLFTKELIEENKQVYLIINQIDKHREEELSFSSFKESVVDSFASWGVYPERIFYTSLKDADHPYNEFEELQKFIRSKLADREVLLPQSVFHSLVKLTKEHEKFLKEQDQADFEKLEEMLQKLKQEEQQQLAAELEKIEAELDGLSSALDRREEELTEEVETILKNAYLMPFETRHLAESFLESIQPDFKAGWFFAKQKTEQERQNRLNLYHENVQEKVKAQVEWHLKELFQNTLKKDDIHDSNLLGIIQRFSVPFDAELLKNTVKPGARLSGDYVLNYTSDTAEAIKKIAREQFRRFLSEYLRVLEKDNEQLRTELEARYRKISKLAAAYQSKMELLEKQNAVSREMEKYLDGNFDIKAFKEAAESLIIREEQVEIIREPLTNAQAVTENEKRENRTEKSKNISGEKNTKTDEERLAHMIRKLKYAAGELRALPGFRNKARELFEKAERLEYRSFTVALFGAFSAGKSSFANALIGEKLLPVSPNPTTAAINKILPVNEENRHGTVKVHLKTNETMFDDVNRSLAVFEKKAADFDEALQLIKTVIDSPGDFNADEKTHYSFLHAFYRGFSSYRDKMGEVIITDVADFAGFVANEEKSCLVELIEVYYDCPLTRKGITLVDTPGADSINARHTGVAFEYIKDSDAILFVTYYNHAFSKADREFLIQLGRVKDTFELDKMFFIVNAVDLANNEEEKREVLDYVEGELVRFGIRNPHLFPLSSMFALKEKQGETVGFDPGIRDFENNFYWFIDHDLTDMTVKSGELEMDRSLSQLRAYIQSAMEDKELKAERLRQLQGEHERINGIIEAENSDILLEQLGREIDELTYYIKQRVFYRFNDFFKEAFNPAVLKDDGRNLKKAVKDALENFLKDFGFDFAQELRATTLRVEAFIGKLLKQTMDALSHETGKINRELSYTPFEVARMDGPSFQSAFTDINRDLFKKALSYFKSPKAFFENNDRKLMADALDEALQTPADEFLFRENSKLKAYYSEKLIKETERLKDYLKEQAAEYYEGMYAALKNEIPVGTLREIEKNISIFK